jgi:hypothetical protein
MIIFQNKKYIQNSDFNGVLHKAKNNVAVVDLGLNKQPKVDYQLTT